MDKKTIVVAGATGNLGQLIVKELIAREAQVRILLRSESDKNLIKNFRNQNVEVVEVDYNNLPSLVEACSKASCVVSALSGLYEVIVEAQTQLLHAAVEAGVPRFIPSDYCIDYRPLKTSDNRNLYLRKQFSAILNTTAIKPTSILNGMFTDLLKGQAPVILFKPKRIFFWGDADQKMDFTTMANTAEYTAAAALDDHTPRWLMIAGEEASMRDIQHIASASTGEKFKLFRPGGLGAFSVIIKLTKFFAPGKNEVFPAWQGMQYLYDMLTGIPKFQQRDNDRYKDIKWEKIQDVIKA